MLVLKSHNFSVVRRAARAKDGKGLSANTVAIDGLFVSVWPRDKNQFLADIEAGEIPVRVSARLFTPEGGETRAQVNLTYVGGNAGDLVGSEADLGEDSLAGEEAPAAEPAPKPSEPAPAKKLAVVQ